MALDSSGCSIAAVERDTGLSKELLRMWERRYGFPQPLRDAQGDRLYPAEQVLRLRLLKRLMDAGHRPGQIITLTPEQLQCLLEQQAPVCTTAQPDLDQVVALLNAGAVQQLRDFLEQQLQSLGLRAFILDFVTQVTRQVGQAWYEGRLAVHEEHLYSEELNKLLRQTIRALPLPISPPRVLLTTLPGELHSLGLLMVEALLRERGADVCSFGTQMPIPEVIAAATRLRVDMVGLSFSSSYPAHTIRPALHELCAGLGELPVLIGGEAVRSLRKLPEPVHKCVELPDVLEVVRRWRASNSQPSAPSKPI